MTLSGERAAYWRVPGLALEAMHARFEHYSYPMHAHDTYSFGVTRPARLPDRQSKVDLTAMTQARALLRERFAENITADELARVAGCSRFTLYRGFRAAYGLALSDY
ncbi:hypothetical protein [Streptomyces sp. NPDC056948]|uniref:hypothetical protein n=1 Tax=Streptomyces sp. NPDC056948 TaxID=3345975 RepID=UPI0036347546